MIAFWHLSFCMSPAFGEGFEVLRVARPDGRDCCYDVKHGSRWDLRMDRDRRASASGEVPRVEGDAIIQALSAASVATVPPEAAGLDGVTCSLAVAAGFNVVTYQWWCDLPDEWRALQSAVDVLARLARRVA